MPHSSTAVQHNTAQLAVVWVQGWLVGGAVCQQAEGSCGLFSDSNSDSDSKGQCPKQGQNWQVPPGLLMAAPACRAAACMQAACTASVPAEWALACLASILSFLPLLPVAGLGPRSFGSDSMPSAISRVTVFV